MKYDSIKSNISFTSSQLQKLFCILNTLVRILKVFFYSITYKMAKNKIISKAFVSNSSLFQNCIKLDHRVKSQQNVKHYSSVRLSFETYRQSWQELLKSCTLCRKGRFYSFCSFSSCYHGLKKIRRFRAIEGKLTIFLVKTIFILL